MVVTAPCGFCLFLWRCFASRGGNLCGGNFQASEKKTKEAIYVEGTVYTREKVLAEIQHLNISLNITPESTSVLNGAVK